MNVRPLSLWLPFAAALAVVFYLSSLSSVPAAEYFWDKLLHAVGYGGISVLALRAFHGGWGSLRTRATMSSFGFMVLWFVSDEWHQSFVPGRDASALDVMADVVGFLLAAGAWAAADAIRHRRAPV